MEGCLEEDRKIDYFETLVSILKRYVDMEEKYYTIVALWIIGTYFHDNFRTFPYLYVNASKGSGKTRLLKLIAHLAKNGRVIGLPSEAFIFRKAGKMTFCLDEMEHIERRESQELRLLLNSCYKRGLFIPRVKKTKEGEMVVEEFEAYAPIVIANIWGLDDVLQDRCITIVLERSNKCEVIRKIEAWENDEDVVDLKGFFNNLLLNVDFTTSKLQCSLCSVVTDFKYIEMIWNDIINNYITYNYTNYTNLTTGAFFDELFTSLDWQSGKYMLECSQYLSNFFKKIYLSNIDGRNLEIYFPLFITSSFFSEDIFNIIVSTAIEEIGKKNIEDIFENRDATLVYVMYNYLKDKTIDEWIKINEIKSMMNEVVGEDKERRDGSVIKLPPDWLNPKWIGRAIKRSGLTKNKRRTSEGIEVMFDLEKVKLRAKILGI